MENAQAVTEATPATPDVETTPIELEAEAFSDRRIWAGEPELIEGETVVIIPEDYGVLMDSLVALRRRDLEQGPPPTDGVTCHRDVVERIRDHTAIGQRLADMTDAELFVFLVTAENMQALLGGCCNIAADQLVQLRKREPRWAEAAVPQADGDAGATDESDGA